MITYTKNLHGDYDIFVNGIPFGTLGMKEDGYYDWYPTFGFTSAVSSWVLEDIVSRLNELNTPWEATIDNTN